MAKGNVAVSILTAFSGVSSTEWLALLQRSAREPMIDGVEFPRFPSRATQLAYNGSADEEAMLGAHAFWRYFDEWGRGLGRPLASDSRVLDIGCGWGRITRTFARDVAPGDIHGCDIDATAITACKLLGVAGRFMQTAPNGRLPYPDGYFSAIAASSVFTQLPEPTALALLSEIARVAAKGCLVVFTVEDASFLDGFAIPGIEASCERWRLLYRFEPQAPELSRRFHAGEYVFLSTMQDELEFSDVYGDALIPRAWLEARCAGSFRLLAYDGASPPIGQAVVVAVRD